MRLFLVLITSVLLFPFGCGHAAYKDGNKFICADLTRDFETKKSSNLTDRELNFFLFDAASRGCSKLVDQFVGAGALMNAKDRAGNTALLIASRMGQNAVLRYLLDNGADVKQVNLAGSSALLRAVNANRSRATRLLLEANADPNIANKQGLTPLIAASYNGNFKLVKALVEAGANPAAVDKSGKTALIYAAGKGFINIAQQLLDTDLDPNNAYGNDLTALMWAAGHSNDVPASEGLSVFNLLIDKGAKPDMHDNRGRTSLMIAAGRGHAQIVSRLLELGVDKSRRDKTGNTAIDLAASEEIKNLLLGR